MQVAVNPHFYLSKDKVLFKQNCPYCNATQKQTSKKAFNNIINTYGYLKKYTDLFTPNEERPVQICQSCHKEYIQSCPFQDCGSLIFRKDGIKCNVCSYLNPAEYCNIEPIINSDCEINPQFCYKCKNCILIRNTIMKNKEELKMDKEELKMEEYVSRYEPPKRYDVTISEEPQQPGFFTEFFGRCKDILTLKFLTEGAPMDPGTNPLNLNYGNRRTCVHCNMQIPRMARVCPFCKSS